MLQNGTIIDGKYEILSKIGQGGMSVVYLAMNKKANKQWAVKEVRKEGIKDFDVVRQSLIAETNMLKKLSHPHLPDIVDIIDGEGSFLIVMDYIEGHTLKKHLEKTGAQPQEMVVEWARQLCDVLYYLHTRTPPIIYRDMKPSNVMLKPDGNVMLIDFGTAREYKTGKTEDTTCLGTKGYAAPEQFGGQGQTDARTDIYCLGATLYHLVTGHNPSEPPYEMKPIREWDPTLSQGLEKIILKCTRPNPKERYQNCAELMYDLEHYEEIDDSYRNSLKKRVNRFLRMVGAAALCFVVGIGGTVLAGQATNEKYMDCMARADRLTDADYAQKKELYLEAMDFKPDEYAVYNDLLELYKFDEQFSYDEAVEFLSHADNDVNLTALKAVNEEQYVKVCFEIGKTYWYYYSYGRENTDDNRDARIREAMKWFKIVKNYASKSNGVFIKESEIQMAQTYYDIAEFETTLNRNTMEGTDTPELYQQYFQNIVNFADYSFDSEIVEIEAYRTIMTAIEKYYIKLVRSVGTEEIEKTYREIKQKVVNFEAAGELSQQYKDYILSRCPAIEQEKFNWQA